MGLIKDGSKRNSLESRWAWTRRRASCSVRGQGSSCFVHLPWHSGCSSRPHRQGLYTASAALLPCWLHHLIFNFRGTGRSEGNLDILGWSRDLQAALDFLYSLKEVDKTRFCLLGFSGGAAVSIYTAAHDPRVSSVTTCACPADFRSLPQRETTLDIIQRFRQIGAIRDKDFPPSIEEWEKGIETVSPIKWIDKISPRPLLLVHGDADEGIPLEHAQKLYQKAKEPKELKIIPGAKHNLRLEKAAMDFVLDWLKAKC